MIEIVFPSVFIILGVLGLSFLLSVNFQESSPMYNISKINCIVNKNSIPYFIFLKYEIQIILFVVYFMKKDSIFPQNFQRPLKKPPRRVAFKIYFLSVAGVLSLFSESPVPVGGVSPLLSSSLSVGGIISPVSSLSEPSVSVVGPSGVGVGVGADG